MHATATDPAASRPAPRGATRRGVVGAALSGSAALAVAACGAQAAGGTPPQAQPATVRYLHVDTGQQIWQDTWAKVFASFEAKYPGVKLQVDMVPGIPQSSEKAITTVASGGYYDLFY